MECTVRQVLDDKGREIVCVQKSDTIDAVVRLLNEKHVGAVVVKDREKVVGILTERDLLKKLLAAHKDPAKVRAQDIMTHDVIITTMDATCEACMRTMTKCRIRHLPVYHEKKLVGLVSIGDLTKRLLEDRTTEVNYLKDYLRE